MDVPQPSIGMQVSREMITELMRFEVGGQYLAVDPVRGEDGGRLAGITAQSIGGSEEAIEWFRTQLLNPAQMRSAMLFFLGAPGNGKSYLSQRVTHQLSLLDDRDQSRHYRTYRYELPAEEKRTAARELLVVNDATPRESDDLEPAPLIRSLREYAVSGRFLQANVNRGVLYRELNEAVDDEEHVDIIRWLSGMECEPSSRLASNPSAPNSSLRSATFVASSGMSIEIVAVYMDKYSLLERQPRITTNSKGIPEVSSAMGQRYEIQSPRDTQRKSANHWDATPGGELLRRILSTISDSSESLGHDLDPISANFLNLRNETYRSGVLSFLRNAEIATNRHLSFRDVWSISALAVLGDRGNRQVDQLPPHVWVERHQPPVESGLERLAALIRLATLRTHQALCGAVVPTLFGMSSAGSLTPVARHLETVDPCRDSIPGTYSREAPEAGWATAVADSFSSLSDGGSILDSFVRNAEPLGFSSSLITRFDRELDSEISACLGVDEEDEPFLSLAESAVLLQWYGDYLSRFFALALGISAFQEEIDTYISTWRHLNSSTDEHGRQLENNLADQLVNLILPQFNSNSRQPARLLSALSPRTRSISRPTPTAELAYRAPAQIFVMGRIDGDLVEISLNQNEVAERSELLRLGLDLALIREAKAAVPGLPGLTDTSSNAMPRVERFRAALVTRSGLRTGLRVVQEESLNQISVG